MLLYYLLCILIADMHPVRSRLIRARENLRRRRVNLDAAFDLHEVDKEARKPEATPPSYHDLVQSQKEDLQTAHVALARSRRVLIRELVQVFDVREARPPPPPGRLGAFLSPSNAAFGVGSVLGTIGRRTAGFLPSAALSQSYHPATHSSPAYPPSSSSSTPVIPSYEICSLALPANPSDLANQSLEHIQAVISCTLQFLRLLAFYLGVRLPFEVVWDGGGVEGVGRPWIHAIQGDEDGGWSKYPWPQPLFPPPTLASSQPLSPGSQQSDPYHPLPPIIAAIYGEPSPELLTSHTRLLPSFTTALAMLHYNIAYLLFTQRVPLPYTLPLSHASPPDALRALTALCFSPSEQVGLFSHGALRSPYRLGPPTSPHRGPLGRSREPFDLDFGDLFKALHAAAGTNDGRYMSRRKRGKSGEDDWDIVELDEENAEDGSSRPETAPSSKAKARPRPSK